MGKGRDFYYDKRNIVLVILDADILERLTKWWWRPQNLRSDDFNITTMHHWFSSFSSKNYLSSISMVRSNSRCTYMKYISHFWDRPVPIFSDVRFSYLAPVQDKKNHVRFTRVRFQSFGDSASLVSERLKSYPRVNSSIIRSDHRDSQIKKRREFNYRTVGS
jgi:hypothetical protein